MHLLIYVFRQDVVDKILMILCCLGATRLPSWLRHCATNQNFVGSIPDGVTGIFHLHNPAGRTMVLGSTQPLTEMNTRNIPWEVKAAGA
jgi:hypothetical protein